jgi:hypothetical protein
MSLSQPNSLFQSSALRSRSGGLAEPVFLACVFEEEREWITAIKSRRYPGATAGIVSMAASRCQPWFLVFDRADFREDLVRFALA